MLTCSGRIRLLQHLPPLPRRRHFAITWQSSRHSAFQKTFSKAFYFSVLLNLTLKKALNQSGKGRRGRLSCCRAAGGERAHRDEHAAPSTRCPACRGNPALTLMWLPCLVRAKTLPQALRSSPAPSFQEHSLLRASPTINQRGFAAPVSPLENPFGGLAWRAKDEGQRADVAFLCLFYTSKRWGRLCLHPHPLPLFPWAAGAPAAIGITRDTLWMDKYPKSIPQTPTHSSHPTPLPLAMAWAQHNPS